jgi:hypothetical protein
VTPDELHDIIVANPSVKALADQGYDAAAAAAVNPLIPPAPQQYIPVRTLIYWGALTGVRKRMQAIAQDNTSPYQSLAISYMDMIRDANSPGLDAQDSAIVGAGGFLDGLTAAGILSTSGSGSKAHLISVTPTSPVVVDAHAVSVAWSRYRPEGKVVV